MRFGLLLLPLLALGCGAARNTEDGTQTLPGADSSIEDGFSPTLDTGIGLEADLSDTPGKECKNLQCKQVACSGGKTTALTGTVYNPAKTDPLYNVVVYIPNAKVEPIKSGVSCEKCGIVSGEPVAAALSGPDGKFRLENVPAGDNIPLVIQIGKWRRQVTIPKINPCVDNALDGELTRLPKKKSEGDIPLTAIVTSTYDPTECILRKIGIDDSEFTLMLGGGRIHIFKGNGGSIGPETPPGDVLWGTPDRLKTYDLVAFPCSSTTSNTAYKQNVIDYANAGGRVFATDLSYTWVDASAPSPWNSTANWGSGSTANPFSIETTFPKGKALADWLKNVGATPTYGQIDLTGTFARSTSVNPPTQAWIKNSSTIQHFTFNTPVGAADAMQCGRVVYSSFHVASGGGFGTIPTSCDTKPLTPQEKVLEFMLFDLASCVQTDKDPPKPPPIK
jgi:hypothetical protein